MRRVVIAAAVLGRAGLEERTIDFPKNWLVERSFTAGPKPQSTVVEVDP